MYTFVTQQQYKCANTHSYCYLPIDLMCCLTGPSGHATKRLNTGLVPPKGYMDGFPSLGGEEEHPPCPHCFCGPCVIEMPPDFLMGSSAPHERNREQRYKLYQKFWRLMGGLGLWKHASYKRRKTQKTAEDDPREILPECIVKVIP